jgi:hypothetical protein
MPQITSRAQESPLRKPFVASLTLSRPTTCPLHLPISATAIRNFILVSPGSGVIYDVLHAPNIGARRNSTVKEETCEAFGCDGNLGLWRW